MTRWRHLSGVFVGCRAAETNDKWSKRLLLRVAKIAMPAPPQEELPEQFHRPGRSPPGRFRFQTEVSPALGLELRPGGRESSPEGDAARASRVSSLPRPPQGTETPAPEYPRFLHTIGDELRKRRLDIGLRQRDVADLLGVAKDTVRNWEMNRTRPSGCFLVRLGAFLQRSGAEVATVAS